jgi:hypothetical protein
MAGDWIKFELSTSDKPEVWAIAQACGIDPDAVVGKLLRVWGWFDQQTENGNAPSVSKSLLDRMVGVTGFCDMVINAGWLADDGAVLSVVNFDRHNGKTAKNRALTAKRVSKHRNADVTQAPLAREEKRREEKRRDIGADKPATKRAAALPAGWQPNDGHMDMAAKSGLSIPDEQARFTDYHLAKGSTMKDWDAAFRTWLRNGAKFKAKEQPAETKKPKAFPGIGQ